MSGLNMGHPVRELVPIFMLPSRGSEGEGGSVTPKFETFLTTNVALFVVRAIIMQNECSREFCPQFGSFTVNFCGPEQTSFRPSRLRWTADRRLTKASFNRCVTTGIHFLQRLSTVVSPTLYDFPFPQEVSRGCP